MNRFSFLIRICLVAIAAASCSGDKKLELGGSCSLNSDCTSPLLCKLGSCRKQCVTSVDCDNGGHCVTVDGVSVCQAPTESACSATVTCTPPLVCRNVDNTCRTACPSGSGCGTSQTCTGLVCVDNTELASGNDGSAGAGDGAAGSDMGAAGASGGTGGPDAGTAGATGGTGGPEAGSAGATGGTGGPDAGSAGVGDAGTAVGGDANRGVDALATGIDAPASGVDAPATGSGGSGGSTGDGGPPTAGASGNTCTPGQTPSNFGLVATSDSDPNYTSGVGVLTAAEFLVFNAYSGPASTDGGAGAKVNRIDVQHFDPSTRTSKGKAAPLLTAAGDGSNLYIDDAALAPTGEIAIIYSAATGGTGWRSYGVYLAFLDKNLAPIQSALLFVAVGSHDYQDQSYVQWLNGKFVASSTSYYGGHATIKLGKFGASGSNPEITSVIPTDDPTGSVSDSDPAEGEVALSGSTFAVAYSSLASGLPSLTFIDAMDPFSAEVGTPVTLPSAITGGLFAVAGTSQGFVTVYNGNSPSNALLATFVSNSASGDAGVLPVGATRAFLGGYAYPHAWSARGRSDGTGAGFAVLYPDGSVSFLYFKADGSTQTSPQQVMGPELKLADPGDEVQVTNFGGAFAVSLYSGADHLTRMVASICQ